MSIQQLQANQRSHGEWINHHGVAIYKFWPQSASTMPSAFGLAYTELSVGTSGFSTAVDVSSSVTRMANTNLGVPSPDVAYSWMRLSGRLYCGKFWLNRPQRQPRLQFLCRHWRQLLRSQPREGRSEKNYICVSTKYLLNYCE